MSTLRIPRIDTTRIAKCANHEIDPNLSIALFLTWFLWLQVMTSKPNTRWSAKHLTPLSRCLITKRKMCAKKCAGRSQILLRVGTFKQAEKLVHFVSSDGVPVIRKIVKLACEGECEVRKEAAWILANICTGGNTTNM